MKKELRAQLKAVLAAIPPDELTQRSHIAAELLLGESEYQRACVVMAYLSLPREADSTRIILQAWQDGKRVLVPRVDWESQTMVPIEIHNLDADLVLGEYGLRQPVGGTPEPVDNIDLIVVPGLGFDPNGNRLGRGRGYYDRFLGQPEFRGKTCGFALEKQVVDCIPATPQDKPVEMLVTDMTIRRF